MDIREFEPRPTMILKGAPLLAFLNLQGLGKLSCEQLKSLRLFLI
jgi:hypothetical protein